MQHYYTLSVVCIVNFLMFFVIISKLSRVIQRFDDYEKEVIEKEDLKFRKNQKSLEDLKELFDLNRSLHTNETKGASTNNWENARKAFSPMTRRVDNE